ncbi:MAG TPA: protein kinase [Armatimonadota bacterium]|nr:protein kinase [Armatimonadota bacterium]
MFKCLKCGLEFEDTPPEYCPVCQTLCYVCPWCGRMTDASTSHCGMQDCEQPIKYVRMTPDLRDVMRLGWGELVEIGHVEVRIERAFYFSARVTVYRARVISTTGGRKSEPRPGEVVVVREVMDECSKRVEAVISKLLSVRHPNIVRTYAGAADESRGCYRLLQAWIGDRDLASDHLQEKGGQSADNLRLAQIAFDLAHALEYLHEKGIIHCDLTPFNVLLTDDGTPVISDFGIATLTDDPGRPRGYTPGYSPVEMLPPEDVPQDILGRSWSIGTHTDRFMLGATLFCISCGRGVRDAHPVTRTPVLVPPVDRIRYDLGYGGSPQAPLTAIKRDIDSGLAEWIETLISIEPDARFRNDSEMVSRITKLAKQVGRRKIIPYLWSGRMRKPLKAAALVFIVLMLVFLVRHSYTLTNSPRNLYALAVSDIAGLFKRHDIALKALDNAPVPSAEISWARGRALERLGMLDEAMDAYKNSVKIDPSFTTAVKAVERTRTTLGMTSLQRGLQLYRAGEYYLADQQLTKAEKHGMTSLEGYKALAHIAERRGQISRAAKYWDKICTLDPRSVKAHYRASILFLDSKNLNKAYHHAAKARDLYYKPKPKDNVGKAEMESLIEDVSKACLREGYLDISKVTSVRRIYEKMVWVERAKNLNPTAEVYTKLGNYEERLGDLASSDKRLNHYNKAVDHLKKARKLKPGSISINTHLARCIAKSKAHQVRLSIKSFLQS